MLKSELQTYFHTRSLLSYTCFYGRELCGKIDNLGEVQDEVSSFMLALHFFNPDAGVFAFFRMDTCQPTVLHGVIVQEESSKQHLAQKPEDF
jgi:hypothetical protein